MLNQKVIGLVLFFVLFLNLCVLNTSAQTDSALQAATLKTASTYQAKVDAVRESYAAQRTSLGLNNLKGENATPESDVGQPRCTNTGGGNGGSNPCSSSSKGAPVWMVNMVNLNFYMADTPLWYDSPIGPPMELKLSYNSLTSHGGRFGNKWQLNYESILYEAVDNNGVPVGMMIIMPDGKRELYVANGPDNYLSPYQVFSRLTRLAANHFELTFPDGSVYVYKIPAGVSSTVSLMVEIRDSHGQKLSLGHNAEAKLTTITDALGNVTTLSYNIDGLVIQAADSFGRTALFEYDANRNLTKITDMGGYWTRFTYRHYVLTNYYLESMTHAGGSWGFYFEPSDDTAGSGPYPPPGAQMSNVSRLTITNPGGGKEEYYKSGAFSWYISPKHYIPYTDENNNNYASNVPKTQYNSILTTSSRGEIASVETPEANQTSLSYDDIDGSGNNTGNITGLSLGDASLSYTFNAMGRVTSMADSAGSITTMRYADNGIDLLEVTNGLGTVTFGYNGARDLTSFTDRSGKTKTFTYNGFGQITSTTDALLVTTTYLYNANHLLTEVTRGGQTLKSYTYDALGRIRTYTDHTGLTRTYDYNDLNALTRITYPDGKYVGIVYSSIIPRLVASTTDRSGRTIQYTYSAMNQLTEILSPDGSITRHEYDANGNRTRLIDTKGNATLFDYDDDNRLIRKTFADGKFTSFTYDAIGRLVSFINARNTSPYYPTSIYYHDSNSNLTQIFNYDFVNFTPTVMYEYDIYNRLTGRTDGAGTHAYAYNVDSQLLSLDGPLDNDTLTLQYDDGGRISSYALQNGQSVSYSYDTLGRLTSIQNSAGIFSYTYTGANPLVRRLTRPNGSFTDYQYDSLNRLTLLSNKTSGGTIINQYVYTYNEQDLRSSETVTDGSPIASLLNGSKSYSHNNLNQIVNSSNPNATFTYDADGNMTGGYTPGGFAFTASYDVENRLVSHSHNEMCEYQGMTFECEYKTVYSYNGNGILTQMKKQSDLVADTETNYVLFGSLPLQERDKNNNVTREYTWGLHIGGGIGGLLSLKQNGQSYYYLYDGKGNVTAVINGAQSVEAAYSYDPFGNLLTKAGSLNQPYRFSTKPYDEETGLSYYGYRFYSPALGRWITRDPIAEKGGLNLYAFVGNSPLNWYDPTGLNMCKMNKQWSTEEVQKMLDAAVSKYSSMDYGVALKQITCDSGNICPGNGGSYDFKVKNASDMFDVPGVGQMNAGEFGNYFAGYITGVLGSFGESYTKFGGEVWSYVEYQTGDDAFDQELISRGAEDFKRRHGEGSHTKTGLMDGLKKVTCSSYPAFCQ